MRVRMHYRVQSFDHSLMARGPVAGDETDAVAIAGKLAALVNTQNASRYTDWALLGYDWCPAGGDIWFPVDAGEDGVVDAGEASTSGRIAAAAAAQLRFEARSASGSKASYTLFGTTWDPSDTPANDFRVTTTEHATIAAFVTGLTELSPSFVAIDAGVIIPKLYANVKYNDAIMKQLRGF